MYVTSQGYSIVHPLPLRAIQLYQLCERAGRVCYQSEPSDRNYQRTRDFIARIVRRGHEAVIEHASITVRFLTDRGVTHELVRHRMASYCQESTRYCLYEGDVEIVRPTWAQLPIGRYTLETGGTIARHESGREWLVPNPMDPEATWLHAMLQAEQAYHDLLSSGCSPQDARAVLPNSLRSEIIVTANLREWRHILRLRTSPRAHPQIRALMRPLLTAFALEMPEVFGDLVKDEVIPQENEEEAA